MDSTEHTEHAHGKPNGIAILSYLWILCIVPLIIGKDDPFVKFHAKQGLALFIGEIVLFVIAMIPFLGWAIAWIGNIVAVVLSIIGIVNVAQGKRAELPIVGRFAESFKF